MAAVKRETLHRPVAETSRRLCLDWLDEARQALARLDDPDDAEALHDFRVSLRRLRSTLRAYRPHLKGSSPKKLRRRLGQLASATNAGRDAEVQVAWLRNRVDQLTAEERPGALALIARLEERRDRAYSEARQRIAGEFESLRPQVVARLSSYRAEIGDRPVGTGTFLRVTGALVRGHVDRLRELLGGVSTADDEEAAHAARIAAKRLRYIIEPIRSSVRGAKRLVKDLKKLQDILGELHDTHVLAEELAAAVATAAARQARRLHDLALRSDRDGDRGADQGETPGLMALTRQLAAERDELFGALRERWLGSAASAFYRRTEEMAALMGRTGAPGIEVRRKYLLDGLPEDVEGERGTLIEEGWLPGDEIQERLRKVRTADGVRYYRNVASGSRLSGGELEERISRATFQKLWPLTDGCRLRKRRYRVEEGGLVWAVDAFLDRDLFLAEVEVPDADVRPDLPEWLAPHVRRDVTGKRDFANRTIARRNKRTRRPVKKR